MEAEKQNSIYHTGEQSPSPVPSKQIDTPTGWKYKKFKIGKKTVWYASPSVQLVLVSMVCFLCPGMFNAVSGIGGAGLSNPYVADNVCAHKPAWMRLGLICASSRMLRCTPLSVSTSADGIGVLASTDRVT